MFWLILDLPTYTKETDLKNLLRIILGRPTWPIKKLYVQMYMKIPLYGQPKVS